MLDWFPAKCIALIPRRSVPSIWYLLILVNCLDLELFLFHLIIVCFVSAYVLAFWVGICLKGKMGLVMASLALVKYRRTINMNLCIPPAYMDLGFALVLARARE